MLRSFYQKLDILGFSFLCSNAKAITNGKDVLSIGKVSLNSKLQISASQDITVWSIKSARALPFATPSPKRYIRIKRAFARLFPSEATWINRFLVVWILCRLEQDVDCMLVV